MPAIRLLCHDLCYAHYKAFLAGLSLDTAGLKPGPLLSSRWLPDAGARLLLCNAEGATSKRGFTLRSPTCRGTPGVGTRIKQHSRSYKLRYAMCIRYKPGTPENQTSGSISWKQEFSLGLRFG
eukprot:1142191-Pelagomonas_calceolata.AAC.10